MVLCLACGGGKDGGALESLESPALSPDYDAVYWQAEAADETETWQEAISFCKESAGQPLPNCSVVLKTAFIHGLETALDQPFPEYPSEGGSTGVPKPLEERMREAQEAAGQPEKDEDPGGQ
jgi:hypothetical protein